MKTRITLLIITVLLLTGCGKEHCPGFPDEYADYLPYSPGQRIEFKNNNDTLAFSVYNVYQIKPTEISKCGMCMCDPPMLSFVALRINEDLFFYRIDLDLLLIKPNFLTCDVSLRYDQEQVQPYNDDWATEIPLSTTMPDTLFIINNTTPARISDLTIVKGKGIVFFYDIENQSEWELIN